MKKGFLIIYSVRYQLKFGKKSKFNFFFFKSEFFFKNDKKRKLQVFFHSWVSFKVLLFDDTTSIALVHVAS